MTCHAGPASGSATPPSRQPPLYAPIERAGPASGVALRANNSLAGIGGGLAFGKGASGCGLSVPGSCAWADVSPAIPSQTSGPSIHVTFLNPVAIWFILPIMMAPSAISIPLNGAPVGAAYHQLPSL